MCMSLIIVGPHDDRQSSWVITLVFNSCSTWGHPGGSPVDTHTYHTQPCLSHTAGRDIFIRGARGALAPLEFWQPKMVQDFVCHVRYDYPPRRLVGWLSGGFTPCRHLRPSSGREHTIVTYSVRWWWLLEEWNKEETDHRETIPYSFRQVARDLLRVVAAARCKSSVIDFRIFFAYFLDVLWDIWTSEPRGVYRKVHNCGPFN